MEEMAEILEDELAEAVQVRDRNKLHRYTLLLVQNVASRQSVESSEDHLTKSVDAMVSEMKSFRIAMNRRFDERKEESDRQFALMEQRFEEQKVFFNQRMEESEKRFNRFFTFISLGLGLMMAILSYGTFFT